MVELNGDGGLELSAIWSGFPGFFFFFFFTEMAIEMFCGSWFPSGLGIEIRLISL